jgi:hypothetical protein
MSHCIYHPKRANQPKLSQHYSSVTLLLLRQDSRVVTILHFILHSTGLFMLSPHHGRQFFSNFSSFGITLIHQHGLAFAVICMKTVVCSLLLHCVLLDVSKSSNIEGARWWNHHVSFLGIDMWCRHFLHCCLIDAAVPLIRLWIVSSWMKKIMDWKLQKPLSIFESWEQMSSKMVNHEINAPTWVNFWMLCLWRHSFTVYFVWTTLPVSRQPPQSKWGWAYHNEVRLTNCKLYHDESCSDDGVRHNKQKNVLLAKNEDAWVDSRCVV